MTTRMPLDLEWEIFAWDGKWAFDCENCTYHLQGFNSEAAAMECRRQHYWWLHCDHMVDVMHDDVKRGYGRTFKGLQVQPPGGGATHPRAHRARGIRRRQVAGSSGQHFHRLDGKRHHSRVSGSLPWTTASFSASLSGLCIGIWLENRWVSLAGLVLLALAWIALAIEGRDA